MIGIFQTSSSNLRLHSTYELFMDLKIEIQIQLEKSYNLSFGFFFDRQANLKMNYISLIIQRCSMVKQTIWQSNRASHTKLYFNEFVANALRGNIGIVNFGLRGYGGCQRPKTPLGGQNWHEGVDLLKKVLNESCSATSKTP